MGKYVWNMARKVDNMWVKWVDHVYMKGKDWWTYSPNTAASWYSKQVCKVKDILKAGFNQNGWMDTGYKAKLGYSFLRPEQAHVR